jgi:hypothetical protein
VFSAASVGSVLSAGSAWSLRAWRGVGQLPSGGRQTRRGSDWLPLIAPR